MYKTLIVTVASVKQHQLHSPNNSLFLIDPMTLTWIYFWALYPMPLVNWSTFALEQPLSVARAKGLFHLFIYEMLRKDLAALATFPVTVTKYSTKATSRKKEAFILAYALGEHSLAWQ